MDYPSAKKLATVAMRTMAIPFVLGYVLHASARGHSDSNKRSGDQEGGDVQKQHAGGTDQVDPEWDICNLVKPTATPDRSLVMRLRVIKVVRAATDVSLMEAKDLVDGAPNIFKEELSRQEAEELKAELERAGARVELW